MGERFDVAVIGAGITGLATAFFLRGRGIETVVLERTGIGAGASGVQPGGVRAQWSTRVNCLLALESQRFYRELDADARLEPTGYLFLAHGEEMLAELTANVALQNELGIPSRILGRAETAELVPGLDVRSVAGAAWNGDDGYFDRPQAVVEAFARDARVQIADVQRLERESAGWRVGPVRADAVVVAAGHESRALVAPLGADVPIEPEERHLFLSEPIRERLLEPLVVSSERGLAAKQLANGRVLSATERSPALTELLPILSYVTFPVVASGVYDLTPDRQPLVGELDAGLWLAAGFSGHGFMLAPAITRRLAAAVAGDPVDELLDAFAPARFARGELEPERRVI
jgi:sarcosine oxidase, subunit beta